MTVSIRKAHPDDGPELGRICFEAFTKIASTHNFPPDFPSVEVARGLMAMLLGNRGFHGIVAEEGGKILGSNFLDERNSVAGIGPITVDPSAQNRGVGARLMREVMDHAAGKGAPGVRLVQAAYHGRSLSLYLKLGFDVREPLSCLQGPAIHQAVDGYPVRPATTADIAACNALCARAHGVHRGGELSQAVEQGVAHLVERGGRITGYASQVAFFGHGVGETNDDLKALISAVDAFHAPGFLAPTRNGELMRWCLASGLRVTQPLTLMTIGLYSEPLGAWLPSILY